MENLQTDMRLVIGNLKLKCKHPQLNEDNGIEQIIIVCEMNYEL